MLKQRNQIVTNITIGKTISLHIKAFGVKLSVSNSSKISFKELLERLKIILPGGFEEIESQPVRHVFAIVQNESSVFELYKNGEHLTLAPTKEHIFDFLDSQIRITIAEYAARKVFVHAGVVGWRDKALIFPGRSYQGKTTLVAALVKKGAEYYSDEYAVLSESGLVYPFAKMLSVRGIVDDFTQVDYPVESFGGKSGRKPIPPGLILFTEYKKKTAWKPKLLTLGQGMMEMLPHTIPIRRNPEYTLKVLNRTLNRVIIAKTRRADVSVSADLILEYFEKNCF